MNLLAPLRSSIHALAPVLLLAGGATAQAAFNEGFETLTAPGPGQHGPASLIAQGWIFQNQSTPLGSDDWKGGSFFTPQSGSGYLEVGSLVTDFFGGAISSWAILPDVAGQQAGDVLTLSVRRVASTNDDRLELRYSPTGGAGGGKDTGSSATDVGDFTELLLEVDPPTTGWALVQVELPGPGAVAIRYVEPNACTFACASSVVGIDTLSIGTPPPPPCNLPPTPVVGESVTWTAAGGPYEICSDYVVVDGATVVVEAGTLIEVDDGRTLSVAGTLIANGDLFDPIVIDGGTSLVTPPLLVTGEAQLNHVVALGRVHVDHGGSLLVADCEFPGLGQISTDSDIAGGVLGTYVQVDRSSFDGDGLSVTDGTLVVRESEFEFGAGISVLRGYLYVDQVTLDGGGLSLTRERYTQPAYLDRLTVLGNAGPALRLYGWNFLLGPDNVLQGNGVPVSLTGGLLRGSIVPATGNVDDWVDLGNGGVVGTSTWSKLDVPYVATGQPSSSGAHLTIEPGARVQFGSGAGLRIISTGDLQARGLPDDPILFEALTPGSSWRGIVFFSNALAPRLEHCIGRDAELLLQADDSFGQVDSCVVEANLTGVKGTTFGSIRAAGSQFRNNGVAAGTTQTGTVRLGGGTNSNSFEGNTLAVEANGSTVDATSNWWGATSGPAAPSNPGGGGDPVTGSVDVSGFLTAAPDSTDHAPIVDLARPYGLMEAGSRVALTWDVQEDGDVAEQRVLFSEHGPSPYATLAVLPGWQRSLEITVPVSNPSSDNAPPFFKVVAVDDAGQEGFDERFVSIPYTADVAPASFTFTSDLSGPFTFGEKVDVAWDYSGPSGTWNTSIVVDGESSGVPYGGATTLSSSWTYRMPYVSTDTARIRVVVTTGAGGRDLWFYSEPFSVRPDARLSDAPPTIALTAPLDAQSFEGGSVVPLAWTASDDEALRSFTVQASYDGGRTWQVVATELPPSTTSYGWQLAGSAGLSDVRVRVVAFDQRFQNSSAELGLDIAPGADTACQPDLGSGGPGGAVLSVCGEPLTATGQAVIRLQGAAASAPAFLLYGFGDGATPFAGGTIVPTPIQLVGPLTTDALGALELPVFGIGVELDVAIQFAVLDPAQPGLFALSNAVRLEYQP